MDESKKGTSAPTDSKESSSFDGDFGKNFLSSWKSAKTGEDQIDFDVESVPRNKKTAFNFDKLDDFELGGDFDKLSSFKMDMPELDFSSPVKKSEKPKGNSCEEIVPGKKKAEQDKFSFSFNFSELDKFDLDPKLLKGEEKTKKSVADGGPDYSTKHGKDKESIMHDDNQESVIHDKSRPLKDKSNIRNDVSKNNGTKRFLNVESMELPSSEHLIEPNTANCASPSTSDHGHQDVSREAVTSSEKKMISVGEKEKATHSKGGEKQQSDGSSFLKRYSENARPNLSRLSVSSDSSAKEVLPQIKNGIASLDSSKADPARELADTARSIDRSQSQNSSPANSCNSGSWRRASTTESPNNTSDTQKVQGNLNQVTRGSTVPSESTKGRQDLDSACAANFSQHSKLLPSPLHRGSMLLKSVSLNEKTTTALQLKPLSINESQPASALTPKQLNAVDNGKIRSMNVRPDYDSRESKQNTATEIGNQKTQDKSSSKDTSVITGSGKIDKSDSSLVQHPPSILPGKTSTVTNNVKNILPNSFSSTATKKSLQCISAERQGISLKDRKMYDIGSLKLSGVTNSNINTSNFTMQKETMAVRFLERKLEVPLNTVSKQSNFSMAKKYALSSPSLKRKILEDSKTDPESFNPLKRVMESTTQTRGLLEASPTINERLEVSPRVDSNLVLGTGNPEAYQGNVSMDTLDYSNRVPEMKNLVELELPVLIENDGNVEKAEACAKELDDICNMLRKKNEEAKELLVRSVVNTNALMMLNHPMYDEKIRTLQKKFASMNSSEF